MGSPLSPLGVSAAGIGTLATGQVGETLHCLAYEIATMWRFTRNNGITDGFHTKMEMPHTPGLRLPRLSELPPES